MTIIYFDAFAGVSGDMLLGTLVDCGVSFDGLVAELEKLALKGFHLEQREVKKGTLRGIKIDVVLNGEHHHHRTLPDILSIIHESSISPAVKSKAEQVFKLLAEAESRVHGISPTEVHFHEVGAVDSIVDIVGTLAGLEMLGIEKIYSSPLPLATGYLEYSHGTIPLPAPATAEIIARCHIPTFPLDLEGETVTPTGAALLGSVCNCFGSMPDMVPRVVGYGAGASDRRLPNLLRAFLGEPASQTVLLEEEYVLLQTNIDDMNPEFYDYLSQQLFAAGAADVYLTPIQMKKGRPGIELSVISNPQTEDELCRIILHETTSLGLRFSRGKKKMLSRKWHEVETPLGKARIKIGILGKETVNAVPEYEDCLRLAQTSGRPLKEVYQTVMEYYKKDCK